MTIKIIAQQASFVNQNDAKPSFVRTRIGNRSGHPLIPILHPCERAPSANLSRQPSTLHSTCAISRPQPWDHRGRRDYGRRRIAAPMSLWSVSVPRALRRPMPSCPPSCEATV